MKLFSQFTGIVTLVLVGIFFVLGDVVMFLVVTPLILMFPSLRVRLLSSFARFAYRGVFGLVRFPGGARIDVDMEIPGRGGVLMVMNHQSLLDIPVAFSGVSSGYPRMVTRARYGRGIPLISHMISLYGHILVQPGRTGRQELEALAGTARASTLPVMIYPEGHRTQDGEIRPWKRAGLDVLLSARDWDVYVLVVDGLWRVARLSDFIRNLSGVRCYAEAVGPIHYDGRGQESHDAFVAELHRVMCAKLAEMRAKHRDPR